MCHKSGGMQMHQYILQDIHQIRSIAQQPTQAKRQNTQQFFQHMVSKMSLNKKFL